MVGNSLATLVLPTAGLLGGRYAIHGYAGAGGETAAGPSLALGDALAYGGGATAARPGQLPRPAVRRARRPWLGGAARLSNLATGGETSATMRFGGQFDAAVGAIADPFTGARAVTLNIGGHDLLGLVASGWRTAGPTHPGCGPAVAATPADFAADYLALLVVRRPALMPSRATSAWR
jgi:hypothetical protein